MRGIFLLLLVATMVTGCGGGGGGSSDTSNLLPSNYDISVSGIARIDQTTPYIGNDLALTYQILRSGESLKTSTVTIDSTGFFTFDVDVTYGYNSERILFCIANSGDSLSPILCGITEPQAISDNVWSADDVYINPVTTFAYQADDTTEKIAYSGIINALANELGVNVDDFTTYSAGNTVLETVNTTLGLDNASFESTSTAWLAQIIRRYSTDSNVATLSAAVTEVYVIPVANEIGIAAQYSNVNADGWYIDDVSNGTYAAKFNSVAIKDSNATTYGNEASFDTSVMSSTAAFMTNWSDLGKYFSCFTDANKDNVAVFTFDETADIDGCAWANDNQVGCVVNATVSVSVVDGQTPAQYIASNVPICSESFVDGTQRKLIKITTFGPNF